MKYALPPSKIIELPKLLVRHKLEFIDKKHESEDVYTYFFKQPSRLKYRAGQHFIFTLPHEEQDKGGKSRLFSVSSAPHEEAVAFTTRYLGDEGSSFKKALHSLRKGDHIYARGPSPINDFFEIDINKQYVFILGGIGVTPLRSVLEDILYKKQELNASVVWANSSKDIPFAADFKKYQAELKTISFRFITDPERITAETLHQAAARFNDPIYVIADTPGFLESMELILENELKVNPSKIKSYKYEAGLAMGKGYEN